MSASGSDSLLCELVLVVSGFWDIMGTSASWCGSGWGPGRDPRGCYWPQTLSAKCHTGVLWSGDYSSSDSLISIRPTQLRQILQSVSSPQTTARLEEGLILDNDEAIETRRDNNESVRQAELEGGRKRFLKWIRYGSFISNASI